MSSDRSTPFAKPFLRWVGGKRWLSRQFAEQIASLPLSHYYEPFVGGGAMFFHLASIVGDKWSYNLSDSNMDLITCYSVVKEQLSELVNDLSRHHNTKDYYYSERSKVYDNEVKKASQFIYLNRTSFNGIYRVNRNGVYNVPYGSKQYKSLFDIESISACSRLLQLATLKCLDFKAVEYNHEGDAFLFCDPPYTVAHSKNGFVKYNQKLFSWENQVELKGIVDTLPPSVCYLVTNAPHESIINLYEDIGNQFTKARGSVVSGIRAKRATYEELMVTNIDL